MKETIFVTGDKGMIGSQLVKGLLNAGYAVVGIDRLSDNSCDGEYSHHRCDLDDKERLQIIFDNYKVDIRRFFTVCAIVTVTLLLSDVTSNTATASVALPIVISIVNGLGMNPIPWIYIATIGVNLSYMLPTSIRAIPVGYGLEPKFMLCEGWKMSVIVIVLMSITAYLLLKYWPMFSTI